MKSKHSIVLLTILLIFLSFSCEQNSERVPQYPLNLRINVDYLNQLGIGSVAYLTPNEQENFVLSIKIANGNTIFYTLNEQVNSTFNGLIIYKVSNLQFIAFDRTCTYLPETNYCAISEDPDWVNLFKCPCCNSRFILSESGGMVFDGAAIRDLYIYQSFVDGNYLYISNYN